ncbi:metallophosphoesterase family protein [Methanococcoides orientis]|uniref:metallophosphoesterase family protein n=1 Tax=Methanococcoides orientis TaxID=2822137 RepID=UPI001E4D32E0|nr:metallophosphoesterase family protein [Methanococcoides orientis]UGV41816.1 metallophosphoesterase family protein [Methanococcoides orientis]
MKLLIISDIHGNKDALDAVLSVPHDEVICLGDLVDYGPDPVGCIESLMDQDVPVIKGNHDNAVASKVDCGCGYKYKHLSTATREYTWGQLDDMHMEFLKKLPMHIERTLDGTNMLFTHGSPRSMYEYIKPDTPEDKVLEMIDGVDADFIVIGHSHIPFIRQVGDVTILNPGSVGQPRNGDVHASCAVFDTENHSVELIKCEYDLESLCKSIQKKMPHPKELIGILRRGY